MYAVIEESGKQFKVSAGDRIKIDRHELATEKSVTFDKVLLVGGDGATKVGSPVVAGATVTAEILGAVSGKKLTMQKYKRRKGYSRKIGHRQHYVEVKISAINA
jgi:large subunit ribosomal protein L21